VEESSLANRKEGKIIPLESQPVATQHSELVSVVIPAYNAETTIDDTLISVRSQTHRELEIIVVDDGSTDDTTGVVKAHAALDSRLTLIRQENLGVAAARNIGWQSARSRFIAFVDADDLWAPTKIERQLEILLSGDPRIGFVYTWWAMIDRSNRIRCKVPGRDIDGDVLEQTLLGNFVGHASSPLIRRQALEDVGGFDSGLRAAGMQGCEDTLLYYRIAKRYHFGLVREHLTGYRVVSGRMSSDRPRMFLSWKMVADEMRLNEPASTDTINRGLRTNLMFFFGEALASWDLRQALRLLSLWVPEHLFDIVLVPATVICSKVVFRLQWIGTSLRGDGFTQRRALFPIKSPDSTMISPTVDTGTIMQHG
jgi:cellulose synthase/poly-beta-1,6-N-acetylglucosamine synthase-like glycosyltransferase